MKLIASGVTLSAAMVRSPSFSRSSSSSTMTIRPLLNAAIASSIRAKGVDRFRAPLAISICRAITNPESRIPNPESRFLVCDFTWLNGIQRQPGKLRGAHDVLADDVAFQVDAIADLGTSKIRVRHRIWNE